jgi:predicted RNA binding protein YcfA (HicA-like mRNA interferase family)
MKAKEVIKLLKEDGWQQTSSRGSHLFFTHPAKPGNITVAYHTTAIAKGTLHSIFNQAGWK